MIKSLPKSLVERLRKAQEKKGDVRVNTKPMSWEFPYKNSDRLMSRLKNADHRFNRFMQNKDIDGPGKRVREFDVSRNYPKLGKIIFKRTHNRNAKWEISAVQEVVKKHNQMFSPKNYVLKIPRAYAISDKLVVMAKANFPSISEIISSKQVLQTARGRKFFNSLSEKKDGVKNFQKAVSELRKNFSLMTGDEFREDHFIVVGFKKGQFIFVPLIDVY
jgi:hypothetical protein